MSESVAMAKISSDEASVDFKWLYSLVLAVDLTISKKWHSSLFVYDSV